MRYDEILPRLVPNANYEFGFVVESRLSRLPGDSAPVARDEQIKIYDEYDKIIWLDEIVEQPKLAECEVEWAKIQRERSNEGIDEKRREGYLSYGEQFDMQYWDAINDTTKWVAHISRVKSDNPKL
ncbi:hypothetical protein LCGC14_1151640 [marine sediment metagenome]|uniref:Uncharacterized protein n=1 Tax=marine sediment metagenome TaxID=412755 RepID=A0A0F9M081_9ZZZZ